MAELWQCLALRLSNALSPSQVPIQSVGVEFSCATGSTPLLRFRSILLANVVQEQAELRQIWPPRHNQFPKIQSGAVN